MADPVTGRVFEQELVAIADSEEAGRVELRSPAVGYWRMAPAHGALVTPGGALGGIEILGSVHRLVAPAGARGIVSWVPSPRRGKLPVGYGDRLAILDREAAGEVLAEAEAGEAGEQAGAGLAFRAPTSGRFYSRPGPGKSPFVEVGQEIARGQTVCLLEVMKTFNRVVYGGAGLPERARVVRVRPGDEDDLSADDVILDLEPLG